VSLPLTLFVFHPPFSPFPLLRQQRETHAYKEENSGLGIGTLPGALIAHGISTTIVEIDRWVHLFALKYFSLPTPHTAIIQDAVIYASSLVNSEPVPQYDYIVHDVFTGGAEPVELFTLEFLTDLHTLLKPGGVIALVCLPSASFLATPRPF
jgi:spermidine synthase